MTIKNRVKYGAKIASIVAIATQNPTGPTSILATTDEDIIVKNDGQGTIIEDVTSSIALSDEGVSPIVTSAVPDPVLKGLINIIKGRPEDTPIEASEMSTILILTLYRAGVGSLEGVQYASSLTKIADTNKGGTVSDLSPLSGLTNLREVSFFRHHISDLSPLVNIPSLTSVSLIGNRVYDISMVKDMSTSNIDLSNQQITLDTQQIIDWDADEVRIPNIFIGIDGLPLVPTITQEFVTYDADTNELVIALNRESKTIQYSVAYEDGGIKYSATATQEFIVLPSAIIDVEDVTLKAGEVATFDPRVGVTVTDQNDDVIDFTVSGQVGLPTPGTNETYTLTYSATNSLGVTTIKTRDVTVTNQLPVIENIEDISVPQRHSVDLLEGVVATDFEDGDVTDRIVLDDTTLDVFTPGEYSVVYSITDSDGNETKVTRNISVVANDEPVIEANDVYLFVNDTFDPRELVTASDTEDGDLTSSIVIEENTVDTTTKGTYHVTYSVTDQLNVKVTKTITVIVDERPMVLGAEDVEMSLTKGQSFDKLSGIHVVANYIGTFDIEVSGDLLLPTPGTNEISLLTYKITDNFGRTVALIERAITITNQLPEFNGLGDETIKQGDEYDILAGITVTDHEDGDMSKKMRISIHMANSRSVLLDTTQVGVATVKYSVTDSDGNTVHYTRTITIEPNELPEITVTDIQLKLGTDFNPLDFVTATDVEDGDLTSAIKVIENTVDTTKAGTYVVTYQVTDSFGHIVEKTVNVTVLEGPVLAVSDLVLEVGSTFNALDYVSATDLEDGDLTSAVKVIENTVDTSVVGVYTVTYQVTDSHGYVDEATISVSIEEAPVISATDLVLEVGTTFNALDYVSATDLEDGDVTSSIVVVENTVDTAVVGVYTVTYQVTDSQGFIDEVTINVTIEEAPVMTATDLVLEVGTTFNALDYVSATDLEDGDVTSSIVVVENTVDTAVVGVYTVTYQVTDSQGFIDEVTINVTVEEAPVLVATDVVLEVGTTFNPLDYVSAADLEDGDLTSSIVVVENTVDTAVVGVYTVTYRVTDSQGFIDEVTINVSIEEAPVMTATDLVLEVGTTFNPLDYVSATDLEDGDLTSKIVVVENTVDTAVVGVYTVTYLVTDSQGFTDEITITVTVEEAPVLVATDVVLEVGTAFNPLDYVSATDLEDGDLTSKIVVVENTVNTEVAGVYTVTYLVTDSQGFSDEVTINVSIEEAPVITATDIVLEVGTAFNPLDYVSATDLEDGEITSSVAVVENTVDTAVVGVYTVTYQVTDSQGFVDEMTITVTVEEAPVITATDIILEVGTAFNPLDYVSATDLEDGDMTSSIEVVENTVNTEVAGVYKVTYRVTDSEGFIDEITITVSVEEAPILDVVDIVLTVGDTFNPFDYVVATDLEDGDITSSVDVIENTVNTLVSGVYTVTYKVVDSAGFETTKTIVVIVTDKPVIETPEAPAVPEEKPELPEEALPELPQETLPEVPQETLPETGLTASTLTLGTSFALGGFMKLFKGKKRQKK